MSIGLLKALTDWYALANKAIKNPAIVVPSELDFVPGPGDDLESMIWVLTYAIMLHHQANLKGSDKVDYKRDVVDEFYGSLSYSGLVKLRGTMVLYGSIPLDRDPEHWIPDPVQCKWFRRAMTLVEDQIKSIKPITFDTFDALCDEFMTNE